LIYSIALIYGLGRDSEPEQGSVGALASMVAARIAITVQAPRAAMLMNA
jgi:hypothetical protein